MEAAPGRSPSDVEFAPSAVRGERGAAGAEGPVGDRAAVALVVLAGGIYLIGTGREPPAARRILILRPEMAGTRRAGRGAARAWPCCRRAWASWAAAAASTPLDPFFLPPKATPWRAPRRPPPTSCWPPGSKAGRRTHRAHPAAADRRRERRGGGLARTSRRRAPKPTSAGWPTRWPPTCASSYPDCRAARRPRPAPPRCGRRTTPPSCTCGATSTSTASPARSAKRRPPSCCAARRGFSPPCCWPPTSPSPAGAPTAIARHLETAADFAGRAAALAAGRSAAPCCGSSKPSWPPAAMPRRAARLRRSLEAAIPGSPELRLAEARLAEHRDDRPAALELYRRAAALQPSWQNLYLAADRELRVGNAEAARQGLDRVLALQPGQSRALAKQAEIELLYGDLATADALFGELIAKRRGAACSPTAASPSCCSAASARPPPASKRPWPTTRKTPKRSSTSPTSSWPAAATPRPAAATRRFAGSWRPTAARPATTPAS